MRRHFAGYYTPSSQEFKALWDNAIFTFDANALLNLYRYKEDTRKRFLDVLSRLKGRVWLSHQATQEYFRNRIFVIQNEIDVYDKIVSSVTKLTEDMQNFLKQFSKHPSIDMSGIQTIVNHMHSEVNKTLDSSKKKHPDFINDDKVLSDLSVIFESRVGDAYQRDVEMEKDKIIEERFQRNIPPGYKDKNKNQHSHGDVLLWFQLIDKSKQDQKPLILVTEDLKEDWWMRYKGKTFGPRPELITEMLSGSGQHFYMYTPEKFLEFSLPYVGDKIDDQAITDIIETRARVEEDSRSPYLQARSVDSLAGAVEALLRIERKLRQDMSRIRVSGGMTDAEKRKQSARHITNLYSVRRLRRSTIQELREAVDVPNLSLKTENYPLLHEYLLAEREFTVSSPEQEDSEPTQYSEDP